MKKFIIKAAKAALQTTFTAGEIVSDLSVNGMIKLRPNKDPERIKVSMSTASIIARSKLGLLPSEEQKELIINL